MTSLPIRWKFALWAAALAGVVLLLFAAGTFANLYHEQLEAVDLELKSAVDHLISFDDREVAERKLEELLRFQPWLAAAIFDDQGRLVRRSPKLPEKLTRAALTQNSVHTVHVASGDSWRMTTVHRDGRALVVGYDLEEFHDIIHDLLLSYAISLPLVLAVAAFGGWWVAGRALLPLRELAGAAENIRPDYLNRRVPEFKTVDEIQRLAVVLNAMLARLESGFEQARRFAADASHELRTPLTIMHGEIDELVRASGIEPEHQRKLASLQEEIGRLNRITEQLLLLARFDAGGTTLQTAPVDFTELVRTACEDMELLAETKKISLGTEIESGVVVQGDAIQLRRLLLNLLDNAVRYNQPAGQIKCRLYRNDFRQAVLTVSNTGTTIPAEAKAQLFQRFFRVNAARTRGGHGLGLSLSREIARAHGGDVHMQEQSAVGWTEFTTLIPIWDNKISNDAIAG